MKRCIVFVSVMGIFVANFSLAQYAKAEGHTEGPEDPHNVISLEDHQAKHSSSGKEAGNISKEKHLNGIPSGFDKVNSTVIGTVPGQLGERGSSATPIVKDNAISGISK